MATKPKQYDVWRTFEVTLGWKVQAESFAQAEELVKETPVYKLVSFNKTGVEHIDSESVKNTIHIMEIRDQK